MPSNIAFFVLAEFCLFVCFSHSKQNALRTFSIRIDGHSCRHSLQKWISIEWYKLEGASEVMLSNYLLIVQLTAGCFYPGPAGFWLSFRYGKYLSSHEKEICFSTFEVKVEYLSGGTELSLPGETKNKIIMFSNYIWFKISCSY